MLGDITGVDALYIVSGYTDMRKSVDGLIALIEGTYHMNPHDNALFLFCGRKCDRIKALYHDNDGFILLYKRLTGDGRYRWPRNANEVRSLTWRQFEWLMEGLEIDQPKAIKPSRLCG